MDQNTWEQVDPQLDEIAEELERLLASNEASKLREMMAKFSKVLPDALSGHLNCSVTVCDSDREATLSLVSVGLGITESGEVYPTSGDASAHRYVVDGEIVVVPNDYCPKCYLEWGFKLDHPKCSHCDAELGVNCWALLDSDVCPFCEHGQISANSPTCTSCGYVIDPKFVRWG